MYIGMTEAYSVAQAAEQMDTNYFGAIRAMQAVLPSMRAAGRGLIINTSSLAGRVSVPFFGTYCATKHALEAYSQSLRYEVAPFGIDVALVEPGPFPSNLLAAGKAARPRGCAGVLWRPRPGAFAMIAGFAQMLASDEAPDPQLVVDAYLVAGRCRPRQAPHAHGRRHHLGRRRGERLHPAAAGRAPEGDAARHRAGRCRRLTTPIPLPLKKEPIQ
jgi:NAD(P)-dependent dehydrogenase (short-subunit alcohol dehydrogenase family)